MMKNGAFVGNTEHFDNEIDLGGSEGSEGMSFSNIKPQTIVFVFPVGHGVIVPASVDDFMCDSHARLPTHFQAQ